MTVKGKIEVFSAGCPACEETVAMIHRLSCGSCEVSILDMQKADVATRAAKLGVRSVPALANDGILAGCCAGGGPDEATLRVAGLGQSA